MKIFNIVITKDPPAGSWCEGLKGTVFNAVSKEGKFFIVDETGNISSKFIYKSYADKIQDGPENNLRTSENKTMPRV